MDTLILMVLTFAGYIIMYRLYGRFIAHRIFKIAPDAQAPAVEFEDGIDYVPTKKEVIFGHHFTSIAGTGPIVGPAIAIIWGWVPAMIWVFVGSIVMGAVHDFGALIISMRNQGKSISDYTSKYINPRTRLIFFVIVFLELLIVIAVFGIVIAVIFKMFPASVLPVWLEVPIAMLLGYGVYKRSMSVTIWSIIAVVVMYISVVIGYYVPLEMPPLAGIPPTGIWTLVLLAYAFFASVLPVTTLLQPRDFINSHQLMIVMALMVIGVFAASFTGNMELVAPAVQATPKDAPPLWPFLFITIACGAISGFHSLVSSGTSSKQVRSENDSLFVGYGSMLLEGVLATLVIIAVAAGIGLGYEVVTDGSTQILTGTAAWNTHYSSWAVADKGLGPKISAFVIGAANMIETFGIPHGIAVTIMGVFVASFAGTTLDTATRIQRYVVTEMFTGFKINIFSNRFVSTFFVVGTAAALAFATGADGGGALKLWPLFGAVNQTLAALALFIIALYLKRKGGMKWIIAGIPAVFMAVMTSWATIYNQFEYLSKKNILLQIINMVIILIVFWILIETAIKFFKRADESE
ncbi:MAG: carbon starvation protein A [Spirochaetes bacterium]|nr:carbon starvation protein A [Spirochaetota bacterium]